MLTAEARAALRRPVVWTTGLYFLLFGMFMAGAGLHDLARGPDPAIKLLAALWSAVGGVFLLAFLVIILDATEVRRMSARAGAFVLSASLAAAITGTLLCVAELRSRVVDITVVLAFSVIAGLGCIVFRRLQIATRARLSYSAHGVRTVVLTLGAGTIASLSLGLVQDWYEQSDSLAETSPTLVVATSLEEVGEKGNLVAYKATVNVKNPTEHRIQVLASEYHLVGSQIAPAALQDATFVEKLAAPFLPVEDSVQVPRFARGSREDELLTVQAGKLFESSWYFEPDEESTRQYIVFVPAHRFDLLRIEASIVVARADRLRLSREPRLAPTLSGTTVISEWPVVQPSLIRRIFEGESIVWIDYDIGEGYVNILVAMFEESQDADGGIRDVTVQEGERIGLAIPRSAFELSLWRPTEAEVRP
jgi:hypothetical protein